MPRVAGIYSRPTGIDAVANNTIDSGKYNSNVADVEADLNLPRPIVAGGTGATNAIDARSNLGAEVSSVQQQVTNYDSQVWQSGSFWSAPAATGAPNSAAIFAGTAIVIGDNPNHITLFATDQTTGTTYSRIKFAGSWGAWVQQAGSSANLDATYVNVAGDTMTGGLDIHSFLALTDTPSGNRKFLRTNALSDLEILNGANTTVLLRVGDTGNLELHRNILLKEDASGSLKFVRVDSANQFQVINSANTTTIVNVTDAGNLSVTGSIFTPGSISTSNTTASTASTTGALTVAGAVGVGGNVNVGNSINTPGVGNTDTGVQLSPAGILAVSRSTGPSLVVNMNADGGVAYWQRSGTVVGSIGITTTTTSYNTSSDGTLKEDLQPAGITASQILNDTEIYNFKWKGTADERAYGVIAQQAAPIYPGPFFHDPKQDRWFVDYSKYVPVLIQEAKTLRTRVKQLEDLIGVSSTILQRLDVLDKFREKIEAL